MNGYEIIKLRDHSELLSEAALWFHEKWGVPLEAYQESMEDCLRGEAVPQWYIAVSDGRFIGGMGVIVNDFHPRVDLTPNVCAVYVEEDCRGRGIAGRLLSLVCEDMHGFGIDTLYLLTSHIGFYERYGWEYFCMVDDGDPDGPLRCYMHKYKA